MCSSDLVFGVHADPSEPLSIFAPRCSADGGDVAKAVDLRRTSTFVWGDSGIMVLRYAVERTGADGSAEISADCEAIIGIQRVEGQWSAVSAETLV